MAAPPAGDNNFRGGGCGVSVVVCPFYFVVLKQAKLVIGWERG
jgi:hypothetical protein